MARVRPVDRRVRSCGADKIIFFANANAVLVVHSNRACWNSSQSWAWDTNFVKLIGLISGDTFGALWWALLYQTKNQARHAVRSGQVFL